MLLKERRYHLIFNAIKEIIINSDKDIGVLINSKEITDPIKDKFSNDELIYAIRHLVHRDYLETYNIPDDYSQLLLTQKGFDEWLFPYGPEDPKKIFISHAIEDKILAVKIKLCAEKIGFSGFVAHEDIPATDKWRDKLISELKTSGIFIALRTENYTGKQYTEQECGFALAFDKRILSLCIGTKPSEMGFCSEFQGQSFKNDSNLVDNISQYLKKQFTLE